MAKGDKGRIQSNINTQQANTNQQYNQLYQQQQQDRASVNPMQAEERANLNAKYNQLYDTRGISADDAARLRGITGPYTYESGSSSSGSSSSGGDSGGGTSSPAAPTNPLFSRSENVFQDFANTGGVNYGALTESLGGYRELSGKDGGYDPTRLANINSSLGGLRDIAKTGGYSESGVANIRGDISGLRGIGANGGFDPATLGRVQGDISKMRGFGETGGFDQARLDQINRTIGQADEFARTGGISAQDMARLRDPGYEEFANTGGYSGQDRANIRARATAPINALRNQNVADMNRMSAIQGGYNPGGAAAMAKMMRGSSQAMSDAALNAETGIMDKVNQGRQFGIQGRAGQEMGIQNLLSSNKLGGMNLAGSLGMNLGSAQASNRIAATQAAGEADASLANTIAQNRMAGLGASGAMERGLEQDLTGNRMSALERSATGEMGLQSDINQTRLSGLKGITDTTGQAEGMVQQGRMQGAQGLMSVDEARAQEAARQASISAMNAANANAADQARAADNLANRQLASANERFLIETGLGAQQGALSGLGGLYTSQPGYSGAIDNRLAGLVGNQAGANQGYIGQQTQAAQLPSWFDRTMQGLGAAGSLVGAFSGGGAVRPPTSSGYTAYQNPSLLQGGF